jgi:hypothetical protein
LTSYKSDLTAGYRTRPKKNGIQYKHCSHWDGL